MILEVKQRFILVERAKDFAHFQFPDNLVMKILVGFEQFAYAGDQIAVIFKIPNQMDSYPKLQLIQVMHFQLPVKVVSKRLRLGQCGFKGWCVVVARGPRANPSRLITS